MADQEAIKRVGEQLARATTFAEVFGALPNGSDAVRLKAVKKQFRILVGIVHPDRVAAALQEPAEDAFTSLQAFRQAAERAIGANTYDAPFPAGAFLSKRASRNGSSPVTEIRSSIAAYRLAKDAYRVGDLSAIYRAQMHGHGAAPREALVKIAASPAHGGWLEREAALLARFRDAAPTDGLSRIRQFVPMLLDSFVMKGERGTRHRVTVTSFIPGFVSVGDIIRAHPSGLDPQDAAWIARRIAAQAIAASMAGVVHGAITPDHVLVHPVTHDPLHIGWAHALTDPKENDARITHVADRWRHLYPPEVFAKKAPDERADVYMAGQTIIALLGGDPERRTLPSVVPDIVRRVIMRAVEQTPSRRHKDGRALLDELTKAVRSVWGKQYRPLPMPQQPTDDRKADDHGWR